MPEGSSSEAPVTNPGPSTINTRLIGFFSRSSFDSSGSFRDFRLWRSVVVRPSNHAAFLRILTAFRRFLRLLCVSVVNSWPQLDSPRRHGEHGGLKTLQNS